MKNKVALITFARFPSEMAYGVHLIQIANSFHENNYGVNIYYPRTYNSKTIYTNPKDYYGVTNDIKFIEVNNIKHKKIRNMMLQSKRKQGEFVFHNVVFFLKYRCM